LTFLNVVRLLSSSPQSLISPAGRSVPEVTDSIWKWCPDESETHNQAETRSPVENQATEAASPEDRSLISVRFTVPHGTALKPGLIGRAFFVE
jgi:hypothetical protein